MISYAPAYDQYAGDSHLLFVEKGVIVHTELRDIPLEEYIDSYVDSAAERLGLEIES